MCCEPTGRQHLAWLILGLLVLPLAGCGKKGDPLPPLRTTPLTTNDLVVRQQGNTILLEMSYPSTTISGLTLGGIDAVELLELIKPAPEPLPEPDVPLLLPTAEPLEFDRAARVLVTLRGAELNAAVTGDRIQFRLPLDELPADPTASIFAVRTIKDDEVSAVSNRVTLIPTVPPPPPRALAVEATADGVELSWEADDGLEGFDVFRREAQNRAYGDPIRRVGADQRTYRDRDARYGRRYIYTVRAVASAVPLIWSDEAGEREIDYEDRFAPPLPRNLVALAERASIRLRWDPSTATDVAGYFLYRREPGRDFHRLNDRPITGVEYHDRNLVSGLTYGYRLQVVDQVGNESPLSAPVETTAR